MQTTSEIATNGDTLGVVILCGGRMCKPRFTATCGDYKPRTVAHGEAFELSSHSKHVTHYSVKDTGHWHERGGGLMTWTPAERQTGRTSNGSSAGGGDV